MGEIADSIINGDMDAITGEWLGRGKGFPRSIHGNVNGKERLPGNSQSTVINYLKERGFKTVEIQQAILQEYCTVRKIDKFTKCYSIIRTDRASWKAFKKFVENHLP